ncbi:MAG: eukaryotic-like serine/threonine-protein kinase [Acidobacteriota bacterium]
MTPERWRKVHALFDAALARDPGERERFLEAQTAGDPELKHEVQTLILSHRKAGGFLDEPAWGIAADLFLGTPSSLSGRQLGPYRVGPEIGRGGMGVVYAAEDQRLGRTVALKALTPEFTRDAPRRERLTREARAAASLSHPSIATVFALEEIDGELYIASELIEGATLRTELAAGPVAPDRLLPSLLEIAAALAAAHEHGIVHRDLKPENVIRRRDGHIKVLDFGIARLTSSNAPSFTHLTDAGVALGTPGYMAPEQLTGSHIDARADVFAFGVLAWELATGEHPFGRDSAAFLARMTELMNGRPPSGSIVLPLPGLDAIVRKCLRAAPADRYPSAGSLLIDLQLLQPGSSMPQTDSVGNRLWWWQCHQVSVAILDALMTIAAWGIRHAIPRPYGSALFVLALMIATIAVTLRLNLWFTSRVHPATLSAHRDRLFPVIFAADALLAAGLLGAAAFLVGEHDEMAALLGAAAVATFVSLTLIEPATTRQAGLGSSAESTGRPS